jgi:hypothetical protein
MNRTSRAAAMHVSKNTPDRRHLDLTDELAVRAFIKNCNVTAEQLTKAVEKVGNSLAALRKELCRPDERAAS